MKQAQKEIHDEWKLELKKRNKKYATKRTSERVELLRETRNGYEQSSNQIAKINIQIKELGGK